MSAMAVLIPAVLVVGGSAVASLIGVHLTPLITEKLPGSMGVAASVLIFLLAGLAIAAFLGGIWTMLGVGVAAGGITAGAVALGFNPADPLSSTTEA